MFESLTLSGVNDKFAGMFIQTVVIKTGVQNNSIVFFKVENKHILCPHNSISVWYLKETIIAICETSETSTATSFAQQTLPNT